ncbi:MAG: hypothetical protein K6A38_03845 [Lachnospiraceae bacterium]|nr:hypothetical protein [Lachnospiraceae bacterium]
MKKLTKDELKGLLFKKPFIKRMILMLVGVAVMGICVSVLKLTHLGTDPCSAMNYGISAKTGLQFGHVQVIIAVVLFAIVICFDYSKLGIGTIGNMLVVGYMADFTTWFTQNILHITTLDSLVVRIIVMLIFVFIFVIAVALYINSGLGASAYDVLPYIIQEKLSKLFKRELPFKAVRIGFDAFFTVVALLLGGEAGVITILMVVSLGPVIDWMAKAINKILKLED